METLILVTDFVEKFILLVMLGLSIWSISIVIDRRRRLVVERQMNFSELQGLLDQGKGAEASKWCDQHQSFVSNGIRQILTAKTGAAADRLLSSFVKEHRSELEKGLGVLATLGANAPFIGLFGTVLGVIRSFAFVGSQSGSSAVMSGVSQALYATAMGLLVAIPAVVFYNYFTKQTRDLILKLESLKDLYLARLESK